MVKISQGLFQGELSLYGSYTDLIMRQGESEPLKEGFKEAWKSSLGPAEIAQVSSYILSLQGTTPKTPKAAEGEIWEGE